MKNHRTHVIELFAVCVGIVCSPMVFYYYLRHKFSLADEQIELFGAAYTEALQKPKTDGVRFADNTAQVTMFSLFALGLATHTLVFDFLAAIISFTLMVEWLWRREAAKSPGT